MKTSNIIIILYYANKKNESKIMTIVDDLYDQAIDFKIFKIENQTDHK